MKSYEETAGRLKIMSDPVRLRILDMLACREMCACDLLEYLSISQSTLSHHMKILVDAGFVGSRKDATWVHYRMIGSKINELRDDLADLAAADPDCLCFRKSTIEGEFCG
ncbi:ArsR/SmtB family transcription factor [Spirochaeta dissipatitropha]